MARALGKAGFATVYCTPHLIKGVYGAGNDEVRRGVWALQERLDREGIDVRLVPGREYFLDEFLADYLAEPLPLGDTGLLLVELPRQAQEDMVKDALFRIRQKGFTPLIAHPERSRLLEPETAHTGGKRGLKGLFSRSPFTIHHSPDKHATLLSYLQEIGCQFQGNRGSFAGYYGERTRIAAERLREMGLYSFFGSDGHNAEGLKAVLRCEF